MAWWSGALSCVSLKNENISKSIHRVVSPYLWRNSLWFFQWLTLNITGCFFTGCIINLEITPTWEKGVKKSYLTKGQEIDFKPGKESEQSFFDTSTGNLAHETPKKWKQKENVNAGITWRSGKWFLLDCVHRKNLQNARVLQPVSMSATSKCMTDVWTFTTKTLTLEERLEQRIKMWKKLNEIRSSNRMRCYHQIQKNSWKRLFKKNQIIESFIETCGIYWFPSFREI